MLPVRSTAAVLVGLMLLATSATLRASPVDPEPWTAWRTAGSVDHPLVGKLWSAAQGKFVEPDELKRALERSRFVLLGEVHDNPDAHRLQAWALGTVADRARPMIMEMLSDEQEAGLAAFHASLAHAKGVKPGAQEFAEMVAWNETGWPPFDMYLPVVEVGLSAGLTLVPGSPTRELNRALSKSGIGALGPGESERLKLNEPLTAALEQALNEEIMEGHCNLLPEAALPRMSSVQRFRDASMADRLLAHASPAGAVLIAGNGHVRRDRAVPWYLERRGVPGDAIVALAVMEVEPGDTDVDHYVPTGPDGRAAVDYVWFTPRAQRADQCEELKNRFQSRR